MAKKSIGTYHATIAATAQPFISELKRADNESRRATASIRASISKTMRDVQREFSLPKLAKGVFAGFGIGGGMQLVDLGITKVVEAFRAGAEHAKEMSEAIDKMRASLRDMRQEKFQNVVENMDPIDRPAAVSRELSFQSQLLADAERKKQQAEADIQIAREGLTAGRQFNPFTGMMTEDPFGGRFEPGTSSNDILNKAVEQQTKALDEIEALRKRIGELTKKHAQSVEEAAKGITKAQEDQFQLYVQELNLNAGRSAAQVRGEITGNEADAGRNALRDMIEEREQKSMDAFQRMERAGALRVDDMTRRGLGTGANYKSAQDQTNNILSQILEVIRAARANAMSSMVPRFGD